jgi:hypothetical protein
MQAQLPPGIRPTLTIDAQAAKRIATLYGVYLLVPWPWDWAPLIGDIVDLLSFVIAYSAIKNAAPRGPSEVAQ